MRTWIVLLRGINVGGSGKLPMKSLVALLTELGYADVRTYIQSGNCVFSSEKTGRVQLEHEIQDAIEREHGFRPAVIAMRQEALANAVEGNPFDVPVEQGASVHCYFLAEPPSDPKLGDLEAVSKSTEAFRLTENVFYLHAPEGIGRSKLAAQVEAKLGVLTTARNFKTVHKLLQLAEK